MPERARERHKLSERSRVSTCQESEEQEDRSPEISKWGLFSLCISFSQMSVAPSRSERSFMTLGSLTT